MPTQEGGQIPAPLGHGHATLASVDAAAGPWTLRAEGRCFGEWSKSPLLGSARLDFLLRRRIQRYGGNTSCLEVTAGGRRLIFDAGTGIRPLGLELARQAPIDIDIYFTHTHLDHIIGLTFFAPLFEKRNSVRLWAGHLQAAPRPEESGEQPDAGAVLSR